MDTKNGEGGLVGRDPGLQIKACASRRCAALAGRPERSSAQALKRRNQLGS